MLSHSHKHTSVRRRAFSAVLLTVMALFAASSSALASQDELKGGSVAIQLQGSRGLKLKPSSLNLPITGGAVDPIDGSGTVQVSGGIQARRGKAKTKVRITALNLAANGGQGSVSAKVGKKGVTPFATLTGGTVTRDGFGAKIENVTITLAGKGAQALNRAFSPKKKGKASAAAKKGVKAGQPLGKVVSVVTVPLAVGIVPNTGTLSLSTGVTGAFANKIPKHCISLLGGVTPIAPATQTLANFSFPVSGGAVAPDFSAGEVLTAGGQKLTKDDGLLTPGGCAISQPAGGHQPEQHRHRRRLRAQLPQFDRRASDRYEPAGPARRHRLLDGHPDVQPERQHHLDHGGHDQAQLPGGPDAQSVLPDRVGERVRRLRGGRRDRDDRPHRRQAALTPERRGRDSNPRTGKTRSTAFKAAAINQTLPPLRGIEG